MKHFKLQLFALLACLFAVVAPGLAFGQSGSMTFGSDAVSTPPTISLPTSNNFYYWNGNGSTRGTQVNDYWLNKVGGELSSEIQVLCGQPLNSTTMAQYTQLSTCFSGLISARMGQNEQVFGSNGSWTAPAGVIKVHTREYGGGGAGGSSVGAAEATGGGGSGYAEGWVTVTPGSTYSVVVGAGGAPAAGANGGNGGQSSFNGVSANGGSGGIAATVSVPAATAGSGGTASGGALNLTGQPGAFAFAIPGGFFNGAGGSSPFNPPSYPGTGSTGAPFGGGFCTGFGVGGGGGFGGGNGASGCSGVVILSY